MFDVVFSYSFRNSNKSSQSSPISRILSTLITCYQSNTSSVLLKKTGLCASVNFKAMNNNMELCLDNQSPMTNVLPGCYATCTILSYDMSVITKLQYMLLRNNEIFNHGNIFAMTNRG